MDRSIPAILGGPPLRTRPFVVGPMVGVEEETLVLDAIRKHNFSRYVGAASPDIENILRMPSKEAAAVRADWHFLGGENVRLFSAEFAERFGSAFAIPLNSATSGLSVALAAAGVGPGDEVIVPAISFAATASAVLLFGSIPVFVDVDPHTFCIDPAAVEAAIGERTRAILPVHLLGNACDMERLMAIAARHRLRVIEDCAQSPGVKYRGRLVGTIGDAGVFSFQQSKNIMTGEGGMILTESPELARKARLILNHGETVLDDHHSDDEIANVIGCNFRMTELVAAVGRAQLPKLDAVNEWRMANYRHLARALADLRWLTPPHVEQGVDYVCHAAAFLYDAERAGCPRDIFAAAVRAEGVPIGTGYVRTMYESPTFLRRIALGKEGWPWTASRPPSSVQYARGQCPIAESLLADRFIWIYHVAHPSTNEDMNDVAAAIHKVATHLPRIAERADDIRGTKLAGRSQGRIL